jgi:putative redox protein
MVMAQADVNVVQVELQDGMRFEARDARGATALMDSASPDVEVAGMSPMEFLLASLAGCTAMDVIGILRKKRQKVTSYRVEVAGERAAEHPRVFTDITLRHVITGHDVADKAVRQAIELSEEKYCSAHAMLSKAAKISTTYEIHAAEPAPVAP